MKQRKAEMIPCTTCGVQIKKPLLPTERPRCFPCIKQEIREAAEAAK